MKIKINLLITLLLMLTLTACGYQPIYSSKTLNINIVQNYNEGDKALSKSIYSKINEMLILKEENSQDVSLRIITKKTKTTASTDSSGNALSYKINLNSELILTNITFDKILIKENINQSENYIVKDQIYENENSEKNVLANLVNRTSQEFLLRISQSNLVK
jgi:outer membrane lipopolysaccharide assembly protein LptE/RlpB